MYTLTATKHIKEWLNANLIKYEVENNNKNILKEYKHAKFTITIYTTNTLLIKGEIKERIYKKLLLICGEENTLGSDEVGVGDFFGPVVYCTVMLDKEALKYLSTTYISIKDSKKINNEEIIKIYKKIQGQIPYQYKIVYDNEVQKYNSIEQKIVSHHYNINKFENKIIEKNIIDLFTTEKSFYKYSQNLNLEWNKNLVLETKADSKYLSVALASMIARALFLEEIAKINNKYNCQVPLGASNVKDFSRKFIKKNSVEELAKICKTSFKTYNEL